MFERIGRPHTRQPEKLTVQELVEGQRHCALAFDNKGDLAAANQAACQMLGLMPKPSIEQLPIDGVSRASIRDLLSQVRASGIPQPLVVRDTMDRPLVLLATDAGQGIVMANAVSGHWTKITERLLCEGFGITTTELTLLRGVYEGLSLRDIAEQRSRSLATVRTQLKAVKQKTGAHTQSELIRLVTGLVFASNSGEQQVLESHAAPRIDNLPRPSGTRKKIALKDKREIYYDDIGPPDSNRVVVFLHGMLDGPMLPVHFAKTLTAAHIRCLCIHRPGYGDSTKYSSNEHLGELFAADLEQFLDVLKLENVCILGHMSGGVLANIAASLLPARVRTVVNINAGVPILHRQQFDSMTPRQRVMALTARYAPRALPLMIRAGIALLDNGGERKFTRALHRHSPRDHRLTQREDVFAQLAKGYRFAIAQGHHAFQRESVLVTSNWDKYVESIECPVTYLHGAHDGVVSIVSVREFAARHPQVKLVECPEYGQLMLYGHPEEIASAAMAALQETAPNRRRSAN